MKIIGAGMSGCLAGIIFPEAEIFEQKLEPPINHNAVLRFRDDSISKITGIPFKKVTVHKGIWAFESFHNPDIKLSNMYSKKVLGYITDRSIWNIKTSERWIAPVDFQEKLYNIVRNKVRLNSTIDEFKSDIIISTAPLVNLVRKLKIDSNLEFKHRIIHTIKFKIKSCDVYQTIYFPSDTTNVYRATITCDNLIIESIFELDNIFEVLIAFNISTDDIIEDDNESTKQFGKIRDIDNNRRKKLLYQITSMYNIYSAGRYAIWKNILMDDVLKDLLVIKQMIASSNYDKLKGMI